MKAFHFVLSDVLIQSEQNALLKLRWAFRNPYPLANKCILPMTTYCFTITVHVCENKSSGNWLLNGTSVWINFECQHCN